MPNTKHVRMSGSPSHYYRGDFEIERVDGTYLGLPASRYCYELRFKEKLVKRFEYREEARIYFDLVFREFQEISKRRKTEDREFVKQYGLCSYPESLD